MSYLSREQILAATDIKQEEVAVPEWGGTVLVRGMSAAERDQFEESMIEGKGKSRRTNLHNFRAKLVSRSVVDEQGRRVFTSRDIEVLGQKNAAALSRIVEVAQRLSGVSDEDAEELTKNSDGDPSDDSLTDSL